MGASSMEGLLIVKSTALICSLISLLFLTSCSSSALKYSKEEDLKKNAEFEKSVVIIKPAEAETESVTSEADAGSAVSLPETKKVDQGKAVKTPKKKVSTPVVKKPSAKVKSASVTKKEVPVVPKVRQPDLEDSVGFLPGSRRPQQDPFLVGEEVIHNVHYFKVSAGELKLKVEPFSMVNDRKSYSFAIEIKTSSVFNAFYSVQDRVETFVDFEDLVPRVFQLHVKESGQLREAKMLFNTENNTAKFWEKKVTKADGEEEKRDEWEILPFTQNVYSAIFYMRNFKWETGKEYAFRVANDKENLIFSGKALRREVLDTKLGPMKAIVIQPNIHLSGKFKPIGDNFIWISDDDRRYILRIESKIKIGTLVSEVISIKPGKP